MTPMTPKMMPPLGGGSPYQANRFSAMLRPMKPNPAANVSVAPGTPATAAGINAVKRAETYHYGRTGVKPSDDVVDNPIKGVLGTRAGETAGYKASSCDCSTMRTSATGEGKTKYKVDPDADAKGHEAFKSLDQYMKKAGLNSFQASFFGRLIQAGMDESQIRQVTKQAGDRFGGAVAVELNDGLEKMAGIAEFLQNSWVGRRAQEGRDLARGAYNWITTDPQAAIQKQMESRYGNLMSLGDMANSAVGHIKNNPMLALAGLGGLGGGYMMGGGKGAMLGGIGLPLIMALAQNPEYFQKMLAKFNLGGAPAAPAIPSPGVAAATGGAPSASAVPRVGTAAVTGAAASSLRPPGLPQAAGAPQVPAAPKPPMPNPVAAGAAGAAAGGMLPAPAVPSMGNLKPPMPSLGGMPGLHLG